MIRVAVTGIGIRCAGSADAAQFWKNVTDGRGMVAAVKGVDIGDSPCRVGGQIDDVPYTGWGDAEDRMLQLLVGVTGQALSSAGDPHLAAPADRVGLVLGQCQGSLVDDTQTQFMHHHLDLLAAWLPASGPRTVISTACTAGAAALALAAERIVAGDADLMVAGGIDVLSGFTWRGFTSLQSLSPSGCAAYSRSDGLVLGEGAGIFVLEPWENALSEGREPLAELAGWGFSADAHHITAPDPSGRGAALAMDRALSRAGLTRKAVDYVCGHGTGTSANDAMETSALTLTFGERAATLPMSSIKPMIGHTLGAAGAIEAAASVFALRDHVLPPTINFNPDVRKDFDFVPNTARAQLVDTAMSNNYAFGGNNSSLIFTRGEKHTVRCDEPQARRVVVTGVGVVAAGVVGYDAWRTLLFEGGTGVAEWTKLDPGSSGLRMGAELPELTPRGVTTPGEWRHLDPLSRLALTVARQAWSDAKLRLTAEQRAEFAVIYGSGTGPVSAIRRFQQSVADGDPSPVHFPNTVYTAAPGHVCKALGVHGPTTTFTSGGVAGMHALEYAMSLITRGEVDRAVVITADELSEWHLSAEGEQRSYLNGGRGIPFERGSTGANLGGAGVAFVLESAEAALQRGVAARGQLLSCTTGGDVNAAMLPDPRAQVWDRVIHRALDRAGVAPTEIGAAVAAANGAGALDSLETGVLSRALGKEILVCAPKATTGETLGASGGIAVLTALAALEQGEVPPTAGLVAPVGAQRVRHVLGKPAPLSSPAILANAFSLGGNYASAVLIR